MSRIVAFEVRDAPAPFRTAFSHASAVRTRAENVIVVVRDEAGIVGVGEGCPRLYVTGETQEGAIAFLNAHREALMALDSPPALEAWIAAHEPEIDKNPSAFCAAELALLDRIAREKGQPIDQMLGVSLPSAIPVTAVYGVSGGVKFAAQNAFFGALGMADAKLKLCGQPQIDIARAKSLARRGATRLDANNLYPDADAAITALLPMRESAWAVEEPVAPRDLAGMARIAAGTGLAIIADESCATLADVAALPTAGTFLPNLRVSKCGGLLRSLRAMRLARASGRRVIVGAQVGETSILARAGFVLAGAAGDALAGLEVGYGRWLLTSDPARPSIGFNLRGRMEKGAWAAAPGLGVTLR